VPGAQKRLGEINALMAAENFWNNSEQARKLIDESNSLRNKTEPLLKAEKQLEDFHVMVELGEAAPEAAQLKIQQELEQDLSRFFKELDSLELKVFLSGRHDQSNCIMNINAGAGGTESCDWANMLLRMYQRWAEARGFKCTLNDYQPGDEAGLKSATFTVTGDYAYGLLHGESGVHRLVRISPFDAAQRRHTSFASVFVSPEIDDSITIEIKPDELRTDTYRSSGKGGQHVNTTDSAVRITHIPTGAVAQCQNERSQHRNREVAMKMLRSRLYEMELRRRRQLSDKLEASKADIDFGSQIRSYVLHPYRLVKDHRTKFEVGDADRVLNGDLDPLIKSYLLSQRQGVKQNP